MGLKATSPFISMRSTLPTTKSNDQGNTSASSIKLPNGSGEESELAADGLQDERLGDDCDAPRAKLGNRLLDVGNGEAKMVVASILQAVVEVRVGAHFRGKRVASADYLNVEMIVRGRRQVGELFVGIISFSQNTEIELANIEILRFHQARRTHRNVMAAHISEG